MRCFGAAEESQTLGLRRTFAKFVAVSYFITDVFAFYDDESPTFRFVFISLIISPLKYTMENLGQSKGNKSMLAQVKYLWKCTTTNKEFLP